MQPRWPLTALAHPGHYSVSGAAADLSTRASQGHEVLLQMTWRPRKVWWLSSEIPALEGAGTGASRVEARRPYLKANKPGGSAPYPVQPSRGHPASSLGSSSSLGCALWASPGTLVSFFFSPEEPARKSITPFVSIKMSEGS